MTDDITPEALQALEDRELTNAAIERREPRTRIQLLQVARSEASIRRAATGLDISSDEAIRRTRERLRQPDEVVIKRSRKAVDPCS